MQRLVATALITVGVAVLLGVGWAFLAAGGLVWLLDDRSTAWLVESRDRVWGAAQRLVATPRRSLSATAMGAGLVAVPAGVTVEVGVAVGVIVFGGLLIGFSLLSGWGA
jgi:hypothetical protein